MRNWRYDMIEALEKRITFLQSLITKYKQELSEQ